MDVEVYFSSSEDETVRLGAEFSNRLQPGDIVAFYGDLGAGKTEFIKGICTGMKVQEIVSSPTYTVINQYSGHDQLGRPIEIYHIDLYRIENAAELVELGLGEILSDPTSLKLIEWAEIAGSILPPGRYDVSMISQEDENARRIEIVRRDVAPANASNEDTRTYSK